MKEFIELHKKSDGTEIFVRVDFIQSVYIYEGETIVDMGGCEENYFSVRESYDEVKEALRNG